MEKPAFHLKGLDTIRAVAAISVVIGHIEVLKQRAGLPNFQQLPFFKHTSGHIGVVLFFVLSGYLITLLLLKEREKNGGIDFKKFYVRRILRIWPLYYFIILLGVLLFTYHPFGITLALCLTILPNVANALGVYAWVPSPQIWSIGVEEQFYLGWPFLINTFRKHTLLVLVFTFLFFLVLPHALLFVMVRLHTNPAYMAFVNLFFFGTKFQCMAAGGITAYVYVKKSNWLGFLYNKPMALITLVLPFVLWVTGFHLNFFMEEIYALLFCLTILTASTNPAVFVDTKLTRFLGKISYGIYMYHWMVILLLMPYLKSFFGENNVLANVITYSSTLGITLLVSYLSYHYFEQYFLKLKDRFTTL